MFLFVLAIRGCPGEAYGLGLNSHSTCMYWCLAQGWSRSFTISLLTSLATLFSHYLEVNPSGVQRKPVFFKFESFSVIFGTLAIGAEVCSSTCNPWTALDPSCIYFGPFHTTSLSTRHFSLQARFSSPAKQNSRENNISRCVYAKKDVSYFLTEVFFVLFFTETLCVVFILCVVISGTLMGLCL